MTMNEFQQSVQRNIAKLPGKLEVVMDANSCQVNMKGFLVYMDYHKRKGLKLSSTVYEFSDGIADVEILSFLKAEGKGKKKGDAKIEWDGAMEVLYMKEYPKDIIHEDKVEDFGRVIFAYYNELKAVRKKILTVKHERPDAEEDDDEFMELGMLQKMETASKDSRVSRSRRGTKEQDMAEEASVGGSVAGSVAGSVSSRFGMFKKKKKKQTPDFVQLDDCSDDESIGLLYG